MGRIIKETHYFNGIPTCESAKKKKKKGFLEKGYWTDAF
jgi:hypothetical protein